MDMYSHIVDMPIYSYIADMPIYSHIVDMRRSLLCCGAAKPRHGCLGRTCRHPCIHVSSRHGNEFALDLVGPGRVTTSDVDLAAILGSYSWQTGLGVAECLSILEFWNVQFGSECFFAFA